MNDDNIVKVWRLSAGEEAIALAAVEKLIPEGEREGCVPTIGHLQELLASQTNIVIVATANAVPIGFLSAYVMPRLDRDEKMAYFYEIEVCPQFRRQGIATAMVNELKHCLRSQGVSSLWVGTESNNTPALSLYQSTGAVREPELIHELWYNNI
ncbi:GNAT family N-acetyltransferase [Ferrimonas marina]|uniref:Ribosomal protein S18 acetylase RimI n=1 Tax=Ferrimonas marina TaxID=299255 RepID=A0A1M5YSP0_9GAMM|nr:GNAT family N-acetyltransferase [Ferrimonas marina]SHI15052.1 Ribosomal protein S18 acetylase RimI [Ferrimonas marina]